MFLFGNTIFNYYLRRYIKMIYMRNVNRMNSSASHVPLLCDHQPITFEFADWWKIVRHFIPFIYI